jgi:hypothetical protein
MKKYLLEYRGKGRKVILGLGSFERGSKPVEISEKVAKEFSQPEYKKAGWNVITVGEEPKKEIKIKKGGEK